MKLILKLLWGQIRRQPGRFLLTMMAVVASSGVVIWVVSGYEALVGQFDDFADEYLGRYQIAVAPSVPGPGTSPPLSPIPRTLVEELSRDPAVKLIDWELHGQITLEKRADGPAGNGPTDGARAPGGRGPRGERGPRPAGAANARPAGGDAVASATEGASTAAANPPAASSGGGRGNSAGPAGGPRGGRGPGGRRSFVPPAPPILVLTSAKEAPYKMVEGRWIEPGDNAEGVISRGAAESFNIKVGDRLPVRLNKQRVELKIVGIISQPGRSGGGDSAPNPSRGPATSGLYVPAGMAKTFQTTTDSASIAQILLTDETQPSEFRARWAGKLAELSSPLVFLTAEDIQTDLEESRSASSARNQAYSATGLALLASLFIIFSALSMGVHERTRQFAILRAISLTPRQIGVLIFSESLLLGCVGWMGGLAAGWGLLRVMQVMQPAFFTGGVTLGAWCIALSGVCAIGGALAAAILPALRAMRISPLEAMTGAVATDANRWVGAFTLVGAALIAINPLLVFAWPMTDDSRYPIYVAIGCSTMAIGFILLTPGTILLVERVLGPLVARLLRLDPRLVASELSSNLWRTVGTCVALTLGLGLYVATQIWGYSMLQPFMPGKWVPDLMVNFTTGGLPDDEFKTVAQVKGIQADYCLPLAVEQPMLAQDLLQSAERRTVTRQDNVMLVGIDPDRGIGNDDPLLKLEFVAGDRQSAAKLMKAGRGCVVPDHFANEAGLKLGDAFTVIPPESPDQTVEYTIAGVVKMPGWNWMTKFSGLRRRHGRSAGILLAKFETVREDFALPRTNFFWARRTPGVPLEETGAALKTIADRFPGDAQPVNYQGTWNLGVLNVGPTVRLSTPEEVRLRLAQRSDGVIWGMSQLPLMTLAIAGLGILNTVMASIHARVWSFGVMRAVGLTRFSLARLVLAESLLTGLVACGLSLAFGIMAGWCGAGMSQYVSFFGGLNPSLFIPWPQLAWGIGVTLLLCLLAALWPATRVARMELLSLLQAGRSAM